MECYLIVLSIYVIWLLGVVGYLAFRSSIGDNIDRINKRDWQYSYLFIIGWGYIIMLVVGLPFVYVYMFFRRKIQRKRTRN